MLWKCIATFVWLAYPDGEHFCVSMLSRLGLGFLAVNCNTLSVEETIVLPLDSEGLGAKVWELHPTDFKREQQTAEAIKAQLSAN